MKLTENKQNQHWQQLTDYCVRSREVVATIAADLKLFELRHKMTEDDARVRASAPYYQKCIELAELLREELFHLHRSHVKPLGNHPDYGVTKIPNEGGK